LEVVPLEKWDKNFILPFNAITHCCGSCLLDPDPDPPVRGFLGPDRMGLRILLSSRKNSKKSLAIVLCVLYDFYLHWLLEGQ
jgi:hypothetical protein